MRGTAGAGGSVPACRSQGAAVSPDPASSGCQSPAQREIRASTDRRWRRADHRHAAPARGRRDDRDRRPSRHSHESSPITTSDPLGLCTGLTDVPPIRSAWIAGPGDLRRNRHGRLPTQPVPTPGCRGSSPPQVRAVRGKPVPRLAHDAPSRRGFGESGKPGAVRPACRPAPDRRPAAPCRVRPAALSGRAVGWLASCLVAEGVVRRPFPEKRQARINSGVGTAAKHWAG